MELFVDRMLRQVDLRKRVVVWRASAISFAICLLVVVVFKAGGGAFSFGGNYIARVDVEDIITADRDRDAILKGLAEDDQVKAVLLHINSPGGTIVGGETLYHSIKAISKVKPVVAVLGSVAASGGYMAAIATDHIVARHGTITGSIGVMLQAFEVTELAKKIGVKMVSFKSSPLKGEPSPFQKITPEVAKVMQEGIDDAYQLFVDMVADERTMLTRKGVESVANGQIYTGRQALNVKLVDALGGEDVALGWLGETKDIDVSLPIKGVSLKGERDDLRGFLNSVINTFIPGYDAITVEPGAILVLWTPGVK